MKSSSQDFLEQLAALPPDSFEHRFGQRSAQLGLGSILERNDLTLLCEAALRASLCQNAFNQVAADADKTSPDLETRRVRLEWEFLEARDMFYASPGWQTLDELTQSLIVKIFLTVAVLDECFAW